MTVGVARLLWTVGQRVGFFDVRSDALGWTAIGSTWRARVGNIALDLLAADADYEAHARRQPGMTRRPTTYDRAPDPVIGFFLSRSF